jgi:hypothetical protein
MLDYKWSANSILLPSCFNLTVRKTSSIGFSKSSSSAITYWGALKTFLSNLLKKLRYDIRLSLIYDLNKLLISVAVLSKNNMACLFDRLATWSSF